MLALLAWLRDLRLQIGEWLYWRRKGKGEAIARLRRRRRAVLR